MALSAQAGSAESDYPLGSIELGTGEDTRYKQEQWTRFSWCNLLEMHQSYLGYAAIFLYFL